MKDNKLKTLKWFDGQICDGKSVVHMVSYDASLWGAMDKSREEQSDSSVQLLNSEKQVQIRFESDSK